MFSTPYRPRLDEQAKEKYNHVIDIAKKIEQKYSAFDSNSIEHLVALAYSLGNCEPKEPLVWLVDNEGNPIK